MNGYQFIAEMTKALAWPVVVCLVVWWLRDSIGGSFAKLRRLKWKNLEILFATHIAKAKAVAEQISVPLSTAPKGETSNTEFEGRLTKAEFSSLLEISPRSAIIESWRDVEHEARKALKYYDNGRVDIHLLGSRLKEVGLLDDASLLLFEELRYVRNRALHATDFEPDVEVAKEYIDLASMARNHFPMMTMEHRMKPEKAIESPSS